MFKRFVGVFAAIAAGCGGQEILPVFVPVVVAECEVEVEPFEIAVSAYQWVGGAPLDAATCEVGPCLDYAFMGETGYGAGLSMAQRQSWPVYIRWESAEPVTVPVLGRTTAATEGEIYINPWQSLDVAFCHGEDCSTVVSIAIEATAVVDETCIEQSMDGFYDPAPAWNKSNGEAYGVASLDGEYCASPACTSDAPAPACISNDNPNVAECGELGCQCNLSAWSTIGEKEVRYSAESTEAAGVKAPFFADRWATGGIHADDGSLATFRIYSEVKISDEGTMFRPVVDMRIGWDGSFATIPGPDGSEGPPIFRNADNVAIAPADGYWPVEWEVPAMAPGVAVWMQPIWNVMTKPGAEAGTVDFRNVAFRACGEGVAEVTCEDEGCSY
jgi:hypothetical protein